ncbi:MAG TPA: FlgD immunoglobulin-like domain containing protein [bacterium]|nr:FlgD immunoglobulin-like domain containing protein [bacterium]
MLRRSRLLMVASTGVLLSVWTAVPGFAQTGSWVWEAVLPAAQITEPVLQFDSRGAAWIAGMTSTADEILLYRRDAGVWRQVDAPSSSDFTPPLRYGPSLVVGQGETPYLAVVDSAGTLAVSTRNSSGWTTEIVREGGPSAGVTSNFAVGVSPLGTLQVLYEFYAPFTRELVVAERLDTGWDDTKIGGGIYPFYPRYKVLTHRGALLGGATSQSTNHGTSTSSSICLVHDGYREWMSLKTGWLAGGSCGTELNDMTVDPLGHAHAVGFTYQCLGDPSLPYGPAYWYEDAAGDTMVVEMLPASVTGVGASADGTPRLLVGVVSPDETLVRVNGVWTQLPMDLPPGSTLSPGTWEVMDDASVRMLATDSGSLWYVSDGIDILEPAAGSWRAGESVTVRWLAAPGAVDVSLTTNAGATWTPVVVGTLSDQADVPLPDTPGADVRIRVERPASSTQAVAEGHLFRVRETSDAGMDRLVRSLRVTPATFRGGELRIGFEVAGTAGAEVRLAVYDVLGRRIRELATGAMTAGSHTVSWDGRDGSGRHASSGVYFVRAEAGASASTARVQVLR